MADNPVTMANAQRKIAHNSEDRSNPLDQLRQGWPRDAFGQPLLMFSYSTADVVPTVQYGNASVGPATVTAFVPDGPDEHVLEEMRRIRELAKKIVSEDREILQNEMKARAAAGLPTR